MAVNHEMIEAAPETVFGIITDPSSYPRWVVGARTIRDVDTSWPRPGSAFHHAVGVGPARIHDKTEVLDIQPPDRLVLRARARPAGVARVALHLRGKGSGTEVVLEEHPLGPGARWWGRLLDPVVWLRNIESLRRLKRIAEGR